MWLIWGCVYDLLSLDPCVWFPLDYHLCNNALLFENIVICLGIGCSSFAHCCSFMERWDPKAQVAFQKDKKTKPRTHTRTYMRTTWRLRTYSLLQPLISSLTLFVPFPVLPLRLENTLFRTPPRSLWAHFYWCQSTFPQCLSSLLPLDLLLVGASALSFCFAPR